MINKDLIILVVGMTLGI